MKCAIAIVLVCTWSSQVLAAETSNQQSRGMYMEHSSSDLDTAATGYIYRQDGNGPASIVYLDPSRVSGHFADANDHGYPHASALGPHANVGQFPLDDSNKYYKSYPAYPPKAAYSNAPSAVSYVTHPHQPEHQPQAYKSVLPKYDPTIVHHPVYRNQYIAHKTGAPAPVVYHHDTPQPIIHHREPVIHHPQPIVHQHLPVVHHESPAEHQHQDDDDEEDEDDDDDDESDDDEEGDQDHDEVASYNHGVVLGHVGHGGHGHEDSHHKSEGGKQHGEEHYHKHGHKGNEGYNKEDEYSKGEKGSHDSAHHEGHYDQNGGHKKSEYDEAHEAGAHEEGAKGSKGGKFGEKKHHKKGSKTTGYHNVFHKDEYKKDHTFYDEADHRGHFDKHGNEESYHQSDESDSKKGGHHESAHHNDKYGKKGHTDKGEFDKAATGYKKQHGAEQHHAHEEEYAQKGGQNEGSEHKYATHH